MTITLGWWAIPLAIMLGAVIFCSRPKQKTSGFMGDADFLGAFVFILCSVASLGIIIGKLLF